MTPFQRMKGYPESSSATHAEALAGDLAAAFREGVEKYGLRRLPEEIFVEAAIEALEERLVRAGIAPTTQRLKDLLAMTPRADLVLLIASQHGDREEAMESFRRLHAQRIVQLYQYLGARRAEAEDLAQETVETLTFGAFRRSRTPAFFTYEAKAPVEKWLAGFVWNEWSSRGRARGRSREAREGDLGLANAWPLVLPSAAAAEEQIDARHLGSLVYDAMVRTVHKEALRLEDVKSYCYWVLSRRPQQVLAARLGIDPGTFSRRKTRCQEALGEAVKAELLKALPPGDYVVACQEFDLDLSESSQGLYQPIRRFCRWALRYLKDKEEDKCTQDSPV